jgi:hypothetical protein
LRLAVDCVGLGFLGLLFALAVLCPGRIPNAPQTAAEVLRAAALYSAAVTFARTIRGGFPATLAHTAAVITLHAYLFAAVGGFQHVIVAGWRDDLLISWEGWLTGTELSVWMQRIAAPWLTEWMMFAYVLYVPLLPAVALLCHRGAGAHGAMDYLLNLSLVNVACYTGFILFPVAGPLFHYPERFTVPLGNGLFAWCGEWMRANVHYPGGSLPSPHCAAGTVMMALLYRYRRALFRVTLPVFLTIYAATVYGRYHYAWDVVTGIVAAVVVLRTSPALARLVERLVQEVPAPAVPRLVPATRAEAREEESS